MKKFKLDKYIKKILIPFVVLVSLSGCDLDLNPTYDFNPELTLYDPFADGTAWEFLNSSDANRLNEEGDLDGSSFHYMVAAIKKAGFEDLYNQTETTDRTYLLLNNNAFTGGGDVIQIVTGSSTVNEGETPDQVMERVDTPEKLEKLRALLRYHIVTSYITQVPTLFEYEVDYIFQTLIPGDDGLIAFRRSTRWGITINFAEAPLPTSATSQPENVFNHNYIFNNGIGHHLGDPVRNQPY